MRTYIYVDGESHFERSIALWRELHGKHAHLSQIKHGGIGISGTASYPNSQKPPIRLEPRARFFWDTCYPFLPPYPYNGSVIALAVYFTAFSGDEDTFHEVCVAIRSQRFAPHVIHELRQLADRRQNRLTNVGVVEKAKGVDIGLSVRILEDAYHNVFDVCYLFTSDIDFLPVIRIVQRLGKQVVVFAYKDGLGKRSQLEYVPEAFVDLGVHMKNVYKFDAQSDV